MAIGKDQINEVSKAIENALKALHKNGSYSPAEILKYNELVASYTNIFSAAVNANISSIEMPRAMRKALSENVFIFSGAKTHAQLVEASTLLLDDNGNLKARNTFLLEARDVLAKYNENYLDAEYEFAAASSQSVANWQSIDGDRYNLQYRTAEDERVRDEHQALAGTTLPPSDAFWNSYYPPNGWRCRCVAVEVRKSKFETSNSAEAIEKGEKATTQIGKNGKNKLEMFRFNPGLQQKIFPEGHPYFKVKGVVKAIKALSQENSIDLKSILGNKPVTNKLAKDILLKYAELNPSNFNYGVETFKFSNAKSYLMQHSIAVQRGTGKRVGKSTISISSNTFKISGVNFNPMNEFFRGLEAIRDGNDLTFNQEYSFEALWHEILHAKTKSTHNKLSRYQIQKMETVNQFVARHTYPDFIKSFGGKSIHQNDILSDGYGYNSWIKDFRAKLKELGIEEGKAVEFLEPHLLNNYSNLSEKINELFLNK